MSGDGQLRAFIERILRLKEEQDSLAVDIREVYAEAKGSGFDKTAMGQLVSHLRKVEKVGADAVEEGQTVFDMYLDAYRRATGTAIATHTHEAGSYAEAKGRKGNQSEANNSKASIAKSAEKEIDPSELTDTQEQPETDEPCDCSERVKPGEYYHCPKCDTEWFPEEDNSPSPETPQAIADGEAAPPAASSAPVPNPQPSSPGAVKAPEVGTPPPASGAALSDADVPAFLRTEQRKSIADYRPNCLNPDACGATGLQHCYVCRRAMEAASETEAA